MAQPQVTGDPLAMLAEIVTDQGRRLRKLEHIVYYVAGAASGGGGGWLITIMMTRR